MNEEDMGASADADRAGGLRPEPAAQSQPKALVPSAGMFGVLSGYGFAVVEITKVTEQCFWYTGHRHRARGRETRAYLDKLVCWTTNHNAAERASAQLVSAEAESERRVRAARVWFNQRQAQIAASVDTRPEGRDALAARAEPSGAVPSDSEGDAQP